MMRVSKEGELLTGVVFGNFNNGKLEFEENYKELVEQYKKWNMCRQLLLAHNMMRNDGTEPQCSICLNEPVSYTIAPCGHTFCGTCSKKQTTSCYICRGQIRERIKLFFT